MLILEQKYTCVIDRFETGPCGPNISANTCHFNTEINEFLKAQLAAKHPLKHKTFIKICNCLFYYFDSLIAAILFDI